ncbi:MAG: maleylpyruvate isomerase family mycothiol-dependent enzyme [Acidimicrobiales bacterium]
MSDAKPPCWRAVLEERQDILGFARSLNSDQWEMPSLCTGWRIKDVAAHLLVDEPVQAGMARRVLPLLAKQRFSVDRVNSAWIAQNRDRAPGSIVDLFQEDSLRGVGVIGHLLGPAVALRALVIHHQDMRRPLRCDREVSPDRLVASLDALLTRKGSVSIGSRSRARGLRLRALDVAWSYGDGPEVFGPGEAMVMALAGRGVALEDLKGEGKAVLAERMPS